jgi:hypothetical protein
MSLSIQETDSNLFLFYPKSNDLEIKFYNPSFWESLGFQGVSISVVKTPDVSAEEPSSVSNSVAQTGGGEPEKHTVSFPYNQFIYLLKGNPGQPGRVDTVFQTYGTTKTESENRPAGIYGIFFPMLDGIYKTIFTKKETTATTPAAPTASTTASTTTPSMLSSMMPTQKETPSTSTTNTTSQGTTSLGVSVPDVSKSLPDMSKSLETKPTEIKENNKTLYSSLVDYFSPNQSETQKQQPVGVAPLPVPVPAPEVVPKETISTNSSPSNTLGETKPVEDVPITSTTVSPNVPSKEPETIQPTPTEPSIAPVSETTPSGETQKQPEETVQPTPTEPPIVPAPVPIAPVSETTPSGETETKTGNLFWKMVVPKLSNSPKVFETSEIAEKYEQHFRDVLLQSRMETKSGIYVVGSFYSVLGRKVKIGTVEPASPSKNTLRDYLQTVPELEGSIMSKYKKMLSSATV